MIPWSGWATERNAVRPWSGIRACEMHMQVNHQGSGRWVSIPPVDGALTINVGDM